MLQKGTPENLAAQLSGRLRLAAGTAGTAREPGGSHCCVTAGVPVLFLSVLVAVGAVEFCLMDSSKTPF